MIHQTSNRQIESLGTAPTQVVDYHIDPTATTHITAMLRNMYSDPLKAVFREYLSNAVDAHTAAGILDTQAIDLHLPTRDEPWLAIRDYGGGLDAEATIQLLYGFGASGEEKRQSNNYIGGFGIGCKCGFALSEVFSYTIWHAGIKTVWSCFLNDRDDGQAKQVFTGASDEAAGVEVNIPVPFSENSQSNIQRVLHEVLTFMPGLFNILNEGTYHIPTKLQPAFEMPATCKIDNREHRICYQFFPDWPFNAVTRPAILVGNAVYEIDIDQLGTLPGIEIPYSDSGRRIRRMLSKLVIQAPIGFVQLAPSREQLQYSGLTKKVLQQALRYFLDPSFQMELCQAAIVKDTTINMLQRRHRAELLALDVDEDQSDQYGFLIPHDSVSGCGRYSVTGLIYQSGYLSSTWLQLGDAWKTLAVADKQYVPADWLSSENRNTPLIVVSTTSEEANNAADAAKLVRKAVSKVVADTGKAPRIARVLLLVDPKPDKLKWLQDGSLTPLVAKDLPDEDVSLFPRRSVQRRASRSRTYNPANSLGTKLLKLRTTCKPAANPDANGGWWDKAPLQELREHKGQIVYFQLNQLAPVISGDSPCVYRRASQLAFILKRLRTFPRVFAGAQELYGIRTTDEKTLARVQKDNSFIEFEDYLRQTLAEQINDKLVNADTLLWRMALNDLDWETQERNSQTNVKLLLDTPEFKNLTIAKTFAGWAKYLDRKLCHEDAWSSLLDALSQDFWHRHAPEPSGRLLSLIRLRPTLTGKGPMLDWFAQFKDDAPDFWASEVQQRDRNLVANPIELALKQLRTQLPLLVYASNIETTLLPREEHPSEETSQRLRTLILKDKELRLHLASQVVKLEATQNTGN